MPNNLYLEGPNGIGKTTLAKQLEAQGWKYKHHTVPKHPNRFFMKLGYYLREKFTHHCVYDRCWYSEWVYGLEYRNRSVLLQKDLRDLVVFAAKHSSYVIVFIPEFVRQTASEILLRSFDEKHPYTPSCSELADIVERYNNITMHECVVTKYHLGMKQYASDVFNVDEFLRKVYGWTGENC